MALVNRRKISLYDEAKAGLDSLVKQTAQVFVGLLVMLLVTGGKPPAFVVSLSFCLGVGFVAWSEKKRLTQFEEVKLSNASEAFVETLIDNKNKLETLVYDINKRVDDINKRAVLKRSVTLFSPDFQKLQDLIQQVVEAETQDFSELVKIAGLNLTEDFAGSDLSFTQLNGGDLSGANLSDANLRDANLYSANLSDAKLICANLNSANLSYANLSGANLDGANLSNAKVKKARFGWNSGLSEDMKLDLKQRGAIFEDSPGDRSGVLSPR